MNYNIELLNKLQELKEWYLEGRIDLDELVRFSARAGIDIIEQVKNDLEAKYEQAR